MTATTVLSSSLSTIMATHITLTGYQWLTDENRQRTNLTIGSRTVDVLGRPDELFPWYTLGSLEALVFSAGNWCNLPLMHHWFMYHLDDNEDGFCTIARRDLASLLGKLDKVLAAPSEASDVFASSVYGDIADADLAELRRTRAVIDKALLALMR